MAATIQPVTAQFPSRLEFLFKPARYKVLYGGRGGAKSWAVARWLLIEGVRKPIRVLCARETMKSIADSVHKLLSDQISLLELRGHYRVERARIVGANGTEFVFAGLKHDPGSLKSYEAVDVCWVEEAQTVSHGSWSILIPTIRKPSSEIVLTFNPLLATDSTYQRFVVNPPPGAAVVKVGYADNPWFPDVLKEEMQHLKATDPEEYDHVWEGNCVSMVKGAIYANQFRAIDSENRITRVPYDHSKPVHTAWDLGWADYVSIWCFQVFPFEYRIIDFVEGNRQDLNYYLKVLQSKSYVWGTDYMPHDARAHSLGTGKSIEELMRIAGRRVIVVPALKKPDQINAVRTILPQCWFDAEKCEDGLQHLRHYKYGEQKTLGTDTREPLHDEHSHAADAFVQFAVGVKQPKKEQPKTPVRRTPVSVWS